MKASERIAHLEERLTSRDAQCGQLIGERDQLRREVERLKRTAEDLSRAEAACTRYQAMLERMDDEIRWLRSAVAPGRSE